MSKLTTIDLKYPKMSNRSFLFSLLALLIGACSGNKVSTQADQVEGLLWASDKLTIPVNSKKQIINNADQMLEDGPYSVIEKSFTPPSGDKHDYMSIGIYWWPNPNTEDGLPYVRRDGFVNPEVNDITDKHYFDLTREIAFTCGLAYHFTRNEKYAAKAAEVLRAWFINDMTRMNPNLNYGQGVPGITEGRCYGIIETRDISDALDAERLISNSKSWNSTDRSAIKSWFNDYMNWLLNSDLGKEEFTRLNNHGTWYDVQVASIALGIDDLETAKRILSGSGDRILNHVDSLGRQLQELARTRTWDYSTMNLKSMIILAILGEKVGIDLWKIPNKEDPALRRAIDFLLPYAISPDDWEYEQVLEFNAKRIIPILREALNHYPERKKVYEEALVKLELNAQDPLGMYNLP
ncbi:MAG: alginate lyase family protein [Bacteroidota bacterium]